MRVLMPATITLVLAACDGSPADVGHDRLDVPRFMGLCKQYGLTLDQCRLLSKAAWSTSVYDGPKGGN
jgi:hypothetical protein